MENSKLSAITQLIGFSKDWDKAMAENDVEKISKFMADEWVIVATDGGITSKPDFLRFIKPGGLQHKIMNFENIKVDIYGSTGVIIAKGTSAGTYNGDQFSYYEWSTSVFHKTVNAWLCVLTMLTPAMAEKD